VSLQVILIASASHAVPAGSSDPSSCGFGINMHTNGDYFDDFGGEYIQHVWGDYVNPDAQLYPNRAKHFPNAHIKGAEQDMWMTVGCEFCSDAAQKEAAKGKWAIWTLGYGAYDSLPGDADFENSTKLLGTCENCPAAGGFFHKKAIWTGYNNATQRYKGSTTCCKQGCLDPNACKALEANLLKCSAAPCCHITDIGCMYTGPTRFSCDKTAVSHVVQTNETIV